MPINISSGENFRFVDNKGNDVTTSPNIKAENVKLQIDTNKNHKFDDQDDITVTDTDTIKLLLDNVKGNVPSINGINFTNNIEDHILKNKEISVLLDSAKVSGKKAQETSILNMDKKIEYGKQAFTGVQKAYLKDKGNPEARLAYALSLININNSSFKGTAAKKLDIDIDKLTSDFGKEIQKDNKNILNQLILKEINKSTGKNNSEVDKNLKQLKLEMPKEYAIIESKFNISLKESE